MSIADGGKRASAGALFKELEAQVKTCQLCRLAKTRTNAVPGEGYLRTEVMFIGEGPGYHEDKQGRPFVGAAGQFLNELLRIAGLERESVYITNVVKCRPPNNRDPEPDEMSACAPYLERQIALINPRVIVTLGRFSMSKFFPGERISQIHGTARMVDGRLCVAMYHPAAGLHQASLADIIRSDFRKLPVYVEQSKRMSPALLAEADARTEERLEDALIAQSDVVAEVETGAVRTEDEAPEPWEAVPRTVDTASNVIMERRETSDTAQTARPGAQAVIDSSEVGKEEPEPVAIEAPREARAESKQDLQTPAPAPVVAVKADGEGTSSSKAARKRKNKPQEGDEEYKQLSFF